MPRVRADGEILHFGGVGRQDARRALTHWLSPPSSPEIASEVQSYRVRVIRSISWRGVRIATPWKLRSSSRSPSPVTIASA